MRQQRNMRSHNMDGLILKTYSKECQPESVSLWELLVYTIKENHFVHQV